MADTNFTRMHPFLFELIVKTASSRQNTFQSNNRSGSIIITQDSSIKEYALIWVGLPPIILLISVDRNIKRIKEKKYYNEFSERRVSIFLQLLIRALGIKLNGPVKFAFYKFYLYSIIFQHSGTGLCKVTI